MNTNYRMLVIFLIALSVGACATQLEQVEIREAIEITDQSLLKPIAITKVVATIRRGTVVGVLTDGWLCTGNEEIKWRSGNKVYLSSEDLVDVFRYELEANGWPVVGSTEDLFEGYDVSGAEVLVAARVTDIATILCAPNSGFGDWDMKGSLRLDVEWQVYSPARRSLIGTIITQGSAETDSADDDVAYLLLSDAFAVAANNLIADVKFLEMVQRSSGLASAPAQASATKISNTSENYQTIEAAIASAKLATVTVRTADGHGSGFAIGDGSYVLTNAHVVGNATNVTLVTAGGLEIDATVSSVSKERDTALIRMSGLRLPPFHINARIPSSGATVYAVGSPLAEDLSGTVTSGIISGTRIIDGYEWIQCDAAISPGNSGGPLIDSNGSVVAVSTAGYQSGGSQVGLNLFIPIGDALAYSGLRLD